MGKGQKLETRPGRNRNGQQTATDILAGYRGKGIQQQDAVVVHQFGKKNYKSANNQFGQNVEKEALLYFLGSV